MPTGVPVLGSGLSNGGLFGNDLENSDASTGHARDCQTTPGQARPAIAAAAPPSGLRLRNDRRSLASTEPGVTYVPTHERPITWDLCPEPRHPPLRFIAGNPPYAGSCPSGGGFRWRPERTVQDRSERAPTSHNFPTAGYGRLALAQAGLLELERLTGGTELQLRRAVEAGPEVGQIRSEVRERERHGPRFYGSRFVLRALDREARTGEFLLHKCDSGVHNVPVGVRGVTEAGDGACQRARATFD